MDVRKHRLDNRGMTLVELLIAIVILAIITVPLLHAFVSAARVNLDSRKRLRLTTVAQDVMEGLRADTLEELATEFNYPDAVGPGQGFHVVSRKLVNGGSGGISENRCSIDANGGVTNLTWVNPGDPDIENRPSTELVPGSVSFNFVPRDGSADPARNSGKYYFTMENVTVEDAATATQQVDVIIEADATPYREAGSVSGNDAKHNKNQFVDINDMSERCDYVFYINLQKLLNEHPVEAGGLTTRQVFSEINLELDNALQAKLTVKIHRASDGGELFQVMDQKTKPEVRNIYLFYTPAYLGTMVSGRRDSITFENATTNKVNLCIVKQYDEANADVRNHLSDYEKNYRCDVSIDHSLKNTVLRTNLDYNLKDIEVDANEGKLKRTDDEPAGSPQASIVYNSNVVDDAAKREMYNVFSLGGAAKKDRIFDVRVYVYKEGSIASARTNAGHTIPADNLLVSLDGSIK